MLGGSFAIPISLFWMAWTSRPDISIWSPLAASVLFGHGILCIFITRLVFSGLHLNANSEQDLTA